MDHTAVRARAVSVSWGLALPCECPGSGLLEKSVFSKTQNNGLKVGFYITENVRLVNS